MHHSIRWALGCLLIAAGSVQAATSVDLVITASSHPAACDITLANGGRVDFGTLQRADLNPDSNSATRLSTKHVGWTINCGYAVPIAVQWTDNYAAYGSLPGGTQYFSLGKDASGNPVGAMTLEYGDRAVTADGNILHAISRFAGDASAPWITNLTGIVDNRFVLSFAAPATGMPGAFANYFGDILLNAQIAPLNSLDQTRVIHIDGSATVEVIYL